MRVDSHVCFSPEHPPEHLQAILTRNRFDGAILLVDGPRFPETGPHIAGILARGIDAGHLDECQRDVRFRGVCASLEDGVPAIAEELASRNFSLDLEMRPDHFPTLLALAGRLPNLRIAIDHLARPNYQSGPSDAWLRGMESAAALPNVVCKISGLLTEVAPLPWRAASIRPFVQHALAAFGPQRLMFGSEWPVRLPDVTWKETLAAFTQSIGAQSMEAREQLLGGTAAVFYRLR